MNTLYDEEKQYIVEDAKKANLRQDIKQHCTKIKDGIEGLDESSGDRAIWELIQNARDLSDKACINITLDHNTFIFKHEGRPFTPDSLYSLVKQVSSESKETNDSVGQYGTGFLTTHKFSRQIRIDGSLETKGKSGTFFFDIDNFVIDREFTNVPECIDKVADQIKKIEDMMNNGTSAEQRTSTTLTYPLNEEGYIAARRAMKAAIKLMPYVMVVNDEIHECQFDDEVSKFHIVFTRGSLEDEKGLKVRQINIIENEVTSQFNCYYLESQDKKDKVILPLETATKTCNINDIAKLFLYFPLLGTEKFGVNFIFHSKRFFPVEERNGIRLPISNSNVESNYDSNVNVLEEMSKMLFTYLHEHIKDIDGSIEMASINISTTSNDKRTQSFYENFKKLWTNTFKDLSIIHTKKGPLSINELRVFDSELISFLLEKDNKSKYLDALYYYGSLEDAILPEKENCIRWSQIINEWGLQNTNIFLSIDDIAQKVSNGHEGGDLHNFLEFVRACKQSDLFSKYELIPNREGKLQTSKILKDGKTITEDLYKLARPIVEDSMDKLVDSRYANISGLNEYTLKNLQGDISAKLSPEITKSFPDEKLREALRRYCCAFPTSTADENRRNIMKQVCSINGEDFIKTIISKLSPDEPDLYDTAFKNLLDSELLNISTYDPEWVKNNKENLLNLVKSISDVKEQNFQKRYFLNRSVFPNQKQKLCLATDLKKNEGTDKDKELAGFYNKVFEEDIYEQWVDKDFSSLYQFDPYEAKDVAEKIEKELEKGRYENKLTIDIIRKIDNDKTWEGLFKDIEKNKADIFFKRVPDANRNNVYELMKINDNNTLETLVKLTGNPNMNEMLAKVELLMKEEKQRESDFAFKREIGKRIEDMIRKHIVNELYAHRTQVKTKDNFNSNWLVDDIQNGQDIIISVDGKDIYYIEIKAKWNFTNPAYMSKNQMKMAIKHKENYSLCCVDLTDSKNEEGHYPKIEDIISNIHVHLEIGHELDEIMNRIEQVDSKENAIEDAITMGGDYHCNIPKKVFNKGSSFDELIETIVKNIGS